MNKPASTDHGNQRIIVWDFWIRLFHWSLVLLVLFLLFSGKTGTLFYEYHRYAGEAVLGLLLFRILWGILGSSNARFTILFTNPLKALSHLRHLAAGKSEPERGHNAAGGWAVLGMLVLLIFQAGSGMLIADEEELIEGALYGALSSDLSEELLHLHHTNSSLILAIVSLHVLMIVTYRLRAGVNLVWPMITGKMNWPDNVRLPNLILQRWWVGTLFALVALVGTGRISGWW